MASPKWALFVAYLCVFGYTISALYTFTGLIGVHNMDEDDEDVTKGEKAVDGKVVDPDELTMSGEKLKQFSRKEIAIYVTDLVSAVIMTMISILLVMGLKKQNYKFVAPWLVLSFFDVVVDLSTMFFEEESDVEVAVCLVFILFIASMWYPVYKQYKKMRHPKVVVPEASKMAVYQPGEFVHCTTTMATAPVQEV
ncbi:uncharacterized protein LOC101889047 [Musca domestica]|uniref:Uncharacterized protein LOC101889047 n=1 Tax=Musca domestica TaxID=7370 RepID=A0A1I8N6H8_MUSDO|nr:uncharacterized protein LOC101889047 [Musca domestica]